jgi:uncharacterized protein involved in exopolysaccharide biosynthesis
MEARVESRTNHSPVTSVAADGDVPLVDLERARELAGFGVRAVWRRRRLAAGVFSVAAAAVALTLILMPRTYITEAKILAQRNMVMPALGNPRRTVPSESDMPTKLASEAVLSREALVAIIQQTALLKEWRAGRPILLRAMDRVMDALERAPTEEERIDDLVDLLRKRMWVNSDEGTVTIGIAWPDAQMAYRIVGAAQQNFLEERHASEVSIIGESIAILEAHATEVRATIDSTIDEIRRTRPARSATSRAAAPVVPPIPRVDEEAAGLQARLTAKRQAIADLEEFRNKRMAELQTQLAEQKSTFGAAHPVIASTQQAIAALSVESPQLTALRREERSLVAQLARKGIEPDAVAPSRPLGPMVIPVVHADADTMDARQSYVQSRLRLAVTAYGDLLDLLDGARIELETARAAFKYRYRVLDPVKVPKRPVKPKVPIFLGAGLMLAALLGAAAAVLSDLGSGRVVETWQVERQLGLPVLAAIKGR